jgi:DNA invertase Pin-like site-specific DNA recombinase
MRTQRAHELGRAGRLLAGASLVAATPLAAAAAPPARADAASGAASGPSAGLLLAGVAVLLVAAALVGYAIPASRRRRALVEDAAGGASVPPGYQIAVPMAREDGLDEPTWSTTPETSKFTEPGGERAVGYTTFPERKRAVSPEGRYQARRIRAACEARGMVLHQLVGDLQSYSGPDLRRPGLNHAMELLGGGEASCLVVAGLDRLSRSAANLGTVIEWLEHLGARLVVIDIDLDTHTEEGRLAARALARVGALERTRAEARPAQRRERVDRPSSGGRPAVADLPLLQRRIATMRASGMTLQAIADTLNREGVPTLRGGAKWRPSSVQAATGYKRPSRHEG